MALAPVLTLPRPQGQGTLSQTGSNIGMGLGALLGGGAAGTSAMLAGGALGGPLGIAAAGITGALSGASVGGQIGERVSPSTVDQGKTGQPYAIPQVQFSPQTRQLQQSIASLSQAPVDLRQEYSQPLVSALVLSTKQS